MPLGGRRAGPAKGFDVFNNTTGALVGRNVTAAVAIESATSLTAQQVIDRVAAEHQVVSNGFFIAAHMAVSGLPPIVASGLVDQTGTEEEALVPYTFAAGSFSDPDGQSLTYSALLSSGAALPAWLHFDAATRTFSGTPANGSVGVYTVRVKATDKSGLTVTDDFTYTIAAD